MNEDIFARKIARELETTAKQLPLAIERRLEAMQRNALRHQKKDSSASSWHQHAGSVAALVTHPSLNKRWLALLAVLTLIFCATYWHGHDYLREIEDIDSALLTDPLPPEAFLDQGFSQWLKDSSAE